eukprot:CAMPEP_0177172202 /NCGR_PEP_ID=MMETSP0367-20130122/11010_1 /TAXON_ID=447022 ORGANISM="Scrippsiella hangoei-like, Strain SHHI-4" /NCGR_SAMPLE_ID=MMETSP0367 /ASSEMBLY_ACC=CAM_ASM_000362 /LENGTH=173 /DNA_ID=CAMNT_0018618459 /DNA_START=36 /DNA_END=558 /DNA_ORIENTATION=-
MVADGYAAPLMRACLVSSSPSGSTPERWLVSGHNCDKDVSAPLREGPPALHGPGPAGRRERAAAGAVARFLEAACEKQTHVTRDSHDRKIHWTVSQDPPLFVPEDAAGAHYCLCEIITKAESDLVGGLLSYSWFNSACPSGAQRELCIQALSTKDILRFSSLVDDVTSSPGML